MVITDNHNSISFLRGCQALTWLSESGGSALRKSIMSKTCSKCKRTKPFSDFYSDIRSKDGYGSWCKDCQSNYLYAYNRSEKGKQSQQKRAKRYHKRHPEKVVAKHAVLSAVRYGRLPRVETQICSCGSTAEEYHHYKGYAKEHHLVVIAVCVNCHKKFHQVMSF